MSLDKFRFLELGEDLSISKGEVGQKVDDDFALNCENGNKLIHRICNQAEDSPKSVEELRTLFRNFADSPEAHYVTVRNSIPRLVEALGEEGLPMITTFFSKSFSLAKSKVLSEKDTQDFWNMWKIMIQTLGTRGPATLVEYIESRHLGQVGSPWSYTDQLNPYVALTENAQSVQDALDAFLKNPQDNLLDFLKVLVALYVTKNDTVQTFIDALADNSEGLTEDQQATAVNMLMVINGNQIVTALSLAFDQ